MADRVVATHCHGKPSIMAGVHTIEHGTYLDEECATRTFFEEVLESRAAPRRRMPRPSWRRWPAGTLPAATW
jgi:imidazolonepropionase-like amidohydrolase